MVSSATRFCSSAGVENGGAIARAHVVALPVARRRIVDLEEEFEQRPVAGLGRIENDLDRFGMRAVIAVGRVRHVAAAIADAGRDTPGWRRIKSCMPQKQPPARTARSVDAAIASPIQSCAV